MRERGLKLAIVRVVVVIVSVAPHAGAWIETEKGGAELIRLGGRSPCGSVD